MEYSRIIGFPIVIKPNNGSLSQHVTCNIKSEEELVSAINISKKFSPFFVLEKYMSGDLFRVSVIGKRHVYVAKKEMANVTGDGTSTIAELINYKNNDSRKKSIYDTNSTLRQIEYDTETDTALNKQNITTKTIVPKNKIVYLKYKKTLSHGCDVTSQTSELDKTNKELFLFIAKNLDTNLVGIDCIAKNLSSSYKNQSFSILEFNSFPYVDMHQNPSYGIPDLVASETWDFVISEIKNKPS